jgi:hypothetical protein
VAANQEKAVKTDGQRVVDISDIKKCHIKIHLFGIHFYYLILSI